MEILKYTQQHRDFQNRLRGFIEREVIPNIEQWEKDQIIPRQMWEKMGQEGFLCTAVSPKYGGLGGDLIYSFIVAEEIFRTNQSGLITPLHSDMIVPYIESYGSSEQKEKYLPGCVSGNIIVAVAMTEPDAGSDLAAITTTAVEKDGEVVINGSKTFITNGINCGLVVLAAKDPSVENPHEAISLYLIEEGTQGFNKGEQIEKMGMHSSDTAELFFSNCRIPISHRLGEKGMGFNLLMQKLQQERLMVSIMALTRAESILDWTLDYCRSTKSSGIPLSGFQANQFALVEMATELKVMRTFVEKLVADHMEKQEIFMETSMAKYRTSDMAKQIAGRCLELVGSYGSDESCFITRMWREVQVTSIFAGTNEIMKRIISGSLNL